MNPDAPGPQRELRATYRLQLTSEFGFDRARALIPYLRDLGISHLYLSPSLQAREGSTHGYDVVDPSRLSSALGGEETFRRLAEEAHGAGMGVVLDVVPNHMASDDENRYWADPELRERFFDVDPETGRHRRFFDIGELAGIRIEDEEVFHATHDYVLALVREGVVDGLRVDHPDGLADPGGYLQRLRDAGVARVWVEKILDPGEQLPDWPVSGTVGYEFLNDVCGLFVDRAGEETLTALWGEISGENRPFGELAAEAKLQQATGTFAPEVERLARELPEAERPAEEKLARAVASLPVYRTYIREGRVSEADREAIEASDMAPGIAERLLGKREAPAGFVTRFQQTTPAIMAKGVEDTAFYRYCRLLALNDVGGDPGRFGIDVDTFHAANAERARRFPENLVTTMTHDAKRSADVRARLGALAGMAEAWREEVRTWFELTEELVEDGAPDPVERYFLFQTLVGAWPIELDRVQAYMEKALREAKRNSAWVDGNEDWERRVAAFCARLVAHAPFLERFEPFVGRVAAIGERAALRQLALKLTVPGVPDIYQGDELSYRALVDPDNRRPVDWDWRQAMLRRLMGGSPPDAETRKLFLIKRLLGLRAHHPEVFGPGGSYEPLEAGPLTCAYLRGGRVLVAVSIPDEPAEDPVSLPAGRWRDVLRGEERDLPESCPAGRLLGRHGLAVLERF